MMASRELEPVVPIVCGGTSRRQDWNDLSREGITRLKNAPVWASMRPFFLGDGGHKFFVGQSDCQRS